MKELFNPRPPLGPCTIDQLDGWEVVLDGWDGQNVAVTSVDGEARLFIQIRSEEGLVIDGMYYLWPETMPEPELVESGPLTCIASEAIANECEATLVEYWGPDPAVITPGEPTWAERINE